MTRISPLLVIFFSWLSGCSSPQSGSPPTDGKWDAPPGACIFMSNRVDKIYCGITGTQLLTSPELYDGKLVIVSGWVGGDTHQLTLFLTREALESGGGIGSVVLEGSALQELGPGLERLPSIDRTAPARIAGRFLLRDRHPNYKWDSNRLSVRLGVITDAGTRW
jgi:hypothetical protein